MKATATFECEDSCGAIIQKGEDTDFIDGRLISRNCPNRKPYFIDHNDRGE